MTRRVVLLVALAIAASAPHPVHAQLIRGSVRSATTALVIPEVQVTVRDTAGAVLAATTSDRDGAWSIRLRRRQEPLVVQARRIGYALVATEPRRVAPTDTIDIEFQLAEVATPTDAAVVTGMVPLNEQRLLQAYRRGWRVYEPELIAEYRGRASDFTQLLRAMGVPSLILPRRADDCIRQSRTNQCVAVVVDGQVLGTTPFILPADVYFFAVLQPAESRIEYGTRAPSGAIAIYTRMHGDRAGVRPPR
jgi:Carboxypeptidase regulatory-like domain